jgi:hypothetical protein
LPTALIKKKTGASLIVNSPTGFQHKQIKSVKYHICNKIKTAFPYLYRYNIR